MVGVVALLSAELQWTARGGADAEFLGAAQPIHLVGYPVREVVHVALVLADVEEVDGYLVARDDAYLARLRPRRRHMYLYLLAQCQQRRPVAGRHHECLVVAPDARELPARLEGTLHRRICPPRILREGDGVGFAHEWESTVSR